MYDSILSAQFDRAAGQIRDACPPAPQEACLALTAVSTWWQIQIDPDDHARDHQLETEAKAAIAASQAWTRRDPKSAEAWFYLAGSYAPLVDWRILRGQRLSAARDANRIREALERALAIDPTLSDAYFGIGLYHYYAAVAPAAAKFLRWLLLLPGGNREQGLREIREARDHGLLLSGEADFQLQRIDLWYEHDPEEALTLLGDLDAHHPTNPLFLERIADVRANDLHDVPGSMKAWQTLLDRARAGRVYDATRVEADATRALARERDLTAAPAR